MGYIADTSSMNLELGGFNPIGYLILLFMSVSVLNEKFGSTKNSIKQPSVNGQQEHIQIPPTWYTLI